MPTRSLAFRFQVCVMQTPKAIRGFRFPPLAAAAATGNHRLSRADAVSNNFRMEVIADCV